MDETIETQADATAKTPNSAPNSAKTHPARSGAKWYIVQAYSNFEKKVAEALRTEAEKKGISDAFEEILVPTESIVEVRKGRKIESERKFFPGYVLVKMHLTDAAHNMVKNTPKVTGFLGSGHKPMPVSEEEVARIIGKSAESGDAPRPMIKFDIGETVKVIDGSFQSFNGTVEGVDEENARVSVLINIFGRATPVELDYTQVEKQS